jgi:putative sporulation protein YtxC
MAVWLVEIARDDSNGLGQRLAHGVSGEWEEVRGAVVGYRRRIDGERRNEEARALAGVLARYVVEEQLSSWVLAVAERQHAYLSATEQGSVAARALGRLVATPDALEHWADDVRGRLVAWLNEHDQLTMDGVAPFLLRPLGDAVREAVDWAADRLMMEHEHREFIALLKGFLDEQSPHVAEVHVVPGPSGYRTEDEGGSVVGERVRAEMGLAAGDAEGDALISVLLTLAPRRVVLHRGVEHHVGGREWEIVTAVFGKRADTCRGCSRCERELMGQVDAGPPAR